MSHKHDRIIRKALELWPDVAMFAKSNHTRGQWRHRALNGHFPAFNTESEYAVVPACHAEVAHAYLVEGKELEVFASGRDGFCWTTTEHPSFSSSATYRVKPELPRFYKIGDKFLFGEDLYILAATALGETALINMRDGNRYDEGISRTELLVSAPSLAAYRDVTEQELFEARVDVTTSCKKVN